VNEYVEARKTIYSHTLIIDCNYSMKHLQYKTIQTLGGTPQSA